MVSIIPENPAVFNLKKKADELEDNGYMKISNKFFLNKEEDHSNLIKAQLDYFNLKDDPYGNCRSRAHSRYIKKAGESTYSLDKDNSYFQSKEYNYDDGGKIRSFESISNEFLDNKLIKDIIKFDSNLAFESELIDTTKDIVIGIHQVRYKATKNIPSFSSPIWLHKDDEPVVFLHLISLSNTAVGGDNLIAKTPKEVNEYISLKDPLETLVFGQKVYHAVTPLGTFSNTEAYRDILLVTFSYKETNE